MNAKLSFAGTAGDGLTIGDLVYNTISEKGGGLYFFRYSNAATDNPAPGASGVGQILAWSIQFYITVIYPFGAGNGLYIKYNTDRWDHII